MTSIIADIIAKLAKRKREKEVIPKGYFKCFKCNRILPDSKKVITVPEENTYCEECYFGDAI